MHLSTSHFPKVLTICFISLACLFASCNDDDMSGDNSILAPTSYDAAKHIYGTVLSSHTGTWDAEEVIIDLETGVFGRIEETKMLLGVIHQPSGPMNLTDFIGKRRIFEKSTGDAIVIESLENFEQREIDLTNSNNNLNITNPDFLIFGEDNNTLYLMNSAQNVWSIDLLTDEITLVDDNIDFEGHYSGYFFYLAEGNDLVFMGHTGAINAPKSTMIFRYDLDTKSIIDQTEIPESFGFVLHPDGKRIFGLTSFAVNQGFRLMELKYFNDQLVFQEISNTNLDIDQLSYHKQTIHSSTNSYICRGGATNFDIGENTIYNIDLTSGELTKTLTLEDSGSVLKLAGE